jgi:hypothetical protein
MGTTVACALFSAVSAFVVWLCKQRGMPATVVIIPYIDDFTFVAENEADLIIALAIFEQVCKDIGLFIDPEDPKNCDPTKQLVALGMLFDSETEMVTLAPSKYSVRMYEALLGCRLVEDKIPISRKWWESFIGKAQYMATIYPSMGPRLSALYGPLHMTDRNDPTGKTPLQQLHLWKDNDSRLMKARQVLFWLKDFFVSGKATPQRVVLPSGPQPVVAFSSDASGTIGWGAFTGDQDYYGRLIEEQLKLGKSIADCSEELLQPRNNKTGPGLTGHHLNLNCKKPTGLFDTETAAIKSAKRLARISKKQSQTAFLRLAIKGLVRELHSA